MSSEEINRNFDEYSKFDPEFKNVYWSIDQFNINLESNASKTRASLLDARAKFNTPYYPPKENLTDMQFEALINALKGKNILLCGASGTGKTMLLKKINRHLRAKGLNVIVTSATKFSLQNLQLGGMTLMSMIGCGQVCEGTIDTLVKQIKQKKFLYQKWIEKQVLIIDEINLIRPTIFQKIEGIARYVRGCQLPFGGMQVILCGDWAQLSFPENNEIDFTFETKAFTDNFSFDNIFVFTEDFVHDPLTVEILTAARNGNFSVDDMKVIKAQFTFEKIPLDNIQFVKIVTTRTEYEKKNKEEEEDHKFEAEVSYHKFEEHETGIASILKYRLSQSLPVEETISLKVNSVVIYMATNNEVPFGTQGTVLDFDTDGYPIVHFSTDQVLKTTPIPWCMNEGSKYVQIKQIPLTLGYAMFLYRSFSMFFDYIILDLSKSNYFSIGQAYTALSRCRSIKNVWIIGFDMEAIKYNNKILAFYLDYTKDERLSKRIRT